MAIITEDIIDLVNSIGMSASPINVHRIPLAAVKRVCSKSVRSFGDDDLPRHAFMPFAAEDIAVELEGADLLRHQVDPVDLSRRDVGADPKVRAVEAMKPVQRG